MVRITGNEASILAVIEVVKVVLVASCVSALENLHTVWCMYVLRKHGAVTLYDSSIGRVFDKMFGKVMRVFNSYGVRRDMLRRKKSNVLSLDTGKGSNIFKSAKGRNQLISIRTALLVISVLVSLTDIIALFALSVEGESVADKPEFGVRMQEANDLPIGA